MWCYIQSAIHNLAFLYALAVQGGQINTSFFAVFFWFLIPRAYRFINNFPWRKRSIWTLNSIKLTTSFDFTVKITTFFSTAQNHFRCNIHRLRFVFRVEKSFFKSAESLSSCAINNGRYGARVWVGKAFYSKHVDKDGL